MNSPYVKSSRYNGTNANIPPLPKINKIKIKKKKKKRKKEKSTCDQPSRLGKKKTLQW